ncbi:MULTISPECIES: ribosome maturation factor RimP [Thioalkalivibrio]|uniref:Ribosome maturation factor RimP n=1 Tax=Thioalkalivibrio halophilus TaxID=252474 RepID=A0A1V3A127_9GAMM|nr:MULTISPECIES: ribosome maturation factor RimP [Thioalkalivibrio]OOC11035.1 ribosome maturation factor [Thioalkalivibrio halophilus]
MSEQVEQLKALLGPVVEGQGCELWGIEHHAGSKPQMLRIYIDRSTGVTVDDCARVSEQVSAVLDVEEPIRADYTLEVSSPGIERPLFTPDQFREYVGRAVKVRLTWPEHGRRNYRGQLLSADDTMIEVAVDGTAYELPLAAIHNARVLEEDPGTQS